MNLELHQAPNPPMKAIVIYDNFAFAARATELLQRVAQQVDTAMHWNLKLWRLDTLSLPHRADDALLEAADAHLIVLAGHRTQLLPPWLLDCLERWVACRHVADAAFAVVGGREGNEFVAPRTPELSHFANQHGLRFIIDDDLAFERETDFALRNPDTRSMPFVAGLMAYYGSTAGNFYRGRNVTESPISSYANKE